MWRRLEAWKSKVPGKFHWNRARFRREQTTFPKYAKLQIFSADVILMTRLSSGSKSMNSSPFYTKFCTHHWEYLVCHILSLWRCMFRLAGILADFAHWAPFKKLFYIMYHKLVSTTYFWLKFSEKYRVYIPNKL